jgi:glyoxalase/bleomycin resistance protein/dioxygenase superfamily protein
MAGNINHKNFANTPPCAGIAPVLLAADLTKTASFYSHLGFSVSRSKLSRRLRVERDGFSLFFFEEPCGTEKPVLTGTIYVFPESVDALAQEWQGKIDILWGPELLPYGLYEFGFSDPDGYYLAFAECQPVASTEI